MALILNTCGAGQTRLLGHGFSVGTKRSSDWCKLQQYEASHCKGMKPPSTDEMRPPDALVSCQLTKVNKGEAPALRPEPGVGQFSGGRVPSGHLSSCKGGWCSPSEIVFRLRHWLDGLRLPGNAIPGGKHHSVSCANTVECGDHQTSRSGSQLTGFPKEMLRLPPRR
jgi:hypothetical protein